MSVGEFVWSEDLLVTSDYIAFVVLMSSFISIISAPIVFGLMS